MAVAAFALVLYAPGYLLAWVVDLFGFRRRSLAERSCWAMVCSFGLMPIMAYLAGRVVGLGPLCWVLMAVGIVTLILIFRSVPQGPKLRASAGTQGTGEAVALRDSATKRHSGVAVVDTRKVAGGGACGGVGRVCSGASLVDLQVGKRLYFSVAMFDQSYRVAFTDAVARTGVPPANPLYFARPRGTNALLLLLVCAVRGRDEDCRE